MTSLQLFRNDDGIELIINELTQEIFYPGYRSLARVCSKGLEKIIHNTAISRTVEALLKGDTRARFTEPETYTQTDSEGDTSTVLMEAEIQTSGGLQTVTLIPRKLGTQVIKKHNPSLYEEMADAGHALYLCGLVGYKVKVVKDEPAPTPTPVYLPAVVQFEKVIELGERAIAVVGQLNPTMQQLIKDLMANALIDAKQLKSTEPQECWMGAVNYASLKMGFTCLSKGEHRGSALGKWIKFYYPEIASKMEVRLCNETQRDINVYPVHQVEDGLREAIQKFIDHECPDTQMVKDGAYKRK